jgi:hypothetical protein
MCSSGRTSTGGSTCSGRVPPTRRVELGLRQPGRALGGGATPLRGLAPTSGCAKRLGRLPTRRTLLSLGEAGDRARTGDIQLGRLTLYQLSYTRVDVA